MELKHINAKVSSATHGLLLVYAKAQNLSVSQALDKLVQQNLQGMQIRANNDGKMEVRLQNTYDLKKLKTLQDEGMREYKTGQTRGIDTKDELEEYFAEVRTEAK